MSRILARAALTLLAMVAAVACEDEPLSPGAGGSGAEDPLVEAKVQGGPDEAWTAGDPVRYAAQYAGVADFVGPTGAVLTDPAAITALYTALFTFVFPNTTRQSTIRNLTFLTGTLAVLDIDTRVTGFASPPPGVVPWQPGIIRALEKNILVKRAGEWRIVRHQQTLAAPGT